MAALAWATAANWNALSAYATNVLTGSSTTAWYASSPAPSDRTVVDKAAVDSARQQAKAMSSAFHAAAEQVLPAVVTITSKPKVVKVAQPETGAG